MTHQLGDVVSADGDSIRFDAGDPCIPHRVLVSLAHQTLTFHSFQDLNNRSRQFTKCIDYSGAGLPQRCNLSGVRAAATFNDRTGVTESRSFAGRFAANVCDDGLGHFSVAD